MPDRTIREDGTFRDRTHQVDRDSIIKDPMEDWMELFNLGTRPWEESQSIYHALAHLGRDALCLIEPASPYVCLGYHQDAAKELDWDFIRREGLPVFRREVGGGAVYLDRGQLFYQFILHGNDARLPRDKEALFRFLLQPVIDTFQDFGVPAQFKPVNDILSNGKKISGNGAAEIDGMTVVVGNFLLDFPFERMSQVLRVPDEKFRDKVHKTLEANLTTIPRETGRPAPSVAEVSARFLEKCNPIFGPFSKGSFDGELQEKAKEIAAVYSTPEWVLGNDRREKAGREVKIADGVTVIERVAKLTGGLVRASAVNQHGRLRDVHLSGDFFFYPGEKLPDLEKALESVEVDSIRLSDAIRAFCSTQGVRIPGVQAEELAAMFLPKQ